MADPSAPKFDLAGGTLRVIGDLGPGDEAAFEDALNGLLAEGGKALVIDLCDARYVSSSYVRHVALALMRAREEDRTVTIRAGRRVARVLEMGGVNKLATMLIVNGRNGSSIPPAAGVGRQT